MKWSLKFLTGLLLAVLLLGTAPLWFSGFFHVFGGGIQDESVPFTVEGAQYRTGISREKRERYGLEGELGREDLGARLGTARSETAAYDGAAVYRFADLAEAEDICILEYRKGWFQKVYMGCEAGE